MSDDLNALKANEREAAVEAIARALNGAGEQIDDWQKAQICAAISSLYCGLYWLAQSRADLAVLSPDQHIEFTGGWLRADFQGADFVRSGTGTTGGRR